MYRTHGARVALFCALTLLYAGTHVAAQDYPTKPIRMLVGFPPGGGVDTLARLFGPRLAEQLGQPVVIDNRTGAGGNIAYELLARSPGDGHTLLLTTPTVTVNPALYKKLGYDPIRDFAPVALVATGVYVLVVHPSLPVHSVKDLVALVKAKPGQLNYSSSGNGGAGHLAGALFATAMGMNVVHVPYKGIPAAIISVLTGETQFALASTASIMTHMTSGRLRALAVTSLKRSPFLPKIPSMAEAGVPNYETTAWYGILAPSETPRANITKLNSELIKTFNLPEIKSALARENFSVDTTSPEEFGALLKNEMIKWQKVVKETGMKVD